MENRDFKGVWIPKEVWVTKELTLTEKALLVEINSLDGDQGCFATNNYFAEFFGLSARQISRYISSLTKKGYITCEMIRTEKKEIIKRTLHVNPDKWGNDRNGNLGMDGSVFLGIDGSVQENNTSSSNNSFNSNIKGNSQKRFEKPTVEEIKTYVKSKGYHIDAEYFWNYYESIGWVVGKHKMKDWKRTVDNWEKRYLERLASQETDGEEYQGGEQYQ